MFKKNKIIIGETYTYDNKNKDGQFVDGVTYVVPIEKESNGMYKVKEVMGNDDDTFSVHKDMLSPLNHAAIRNPINCPIITQEDLDILGQLMNIASMNNLINEDKQNRLSALYVKLKYAKELTED